MSQLRSSLILLFLIAFCFLAKAQKTIQPKGLQYDWKGIVYSKERAYNFTFHTHGMRFGMDFGTLKTYYKTRYYHFSIGYLKHPIEIRQNKNQNIEGFGLPASFVYAKQNSFYQFRAGVGVKKYKSEKAKRKGVAVGYNYEIGPVIGLLKPYELVIRTGPNEFGDYQPLPLIYEDNEELFLDYSLIYGRSRSYNSWTKLKLRPGIQAKVAAHFALGAFDEYVRAVEVGLMADYFGARVPIIVENESHSNKALFLNLYITLQLGRRY